MRSPAQELWTKTFDVLYHEDVSVSFIAVGAAEEGVCLGLGYAGRGGAALGGVVEDLMVAASPKMSSRALDESLEDGGRGGESGARAL
jgi:hypothetical protein